jgi:hypothetical protein
MITSEETLGRLVDLLPPLTDANDNDFKVHYNWGSQEVLNKYLKMYKDAVYPLVWLINSNNTENEQTKRINRNARIVIATKSFAVNEFNPYQYENDFLKVLNPVKKNLIKAIRSSGITQLNNEDYNYSFIPNYSFEDNEGTLIDVWNAIVIDLDIEFRTDYTCINTIKF